MGSFRVCQALPYFLMDELERCPQEAERAFTRAFEMTQLDLLEFGDKHDVDLSSSGSTATVVLQLSEQEVLLGWVGDSRALLVAQDGRQARSEIWTAAHNLEDPDELRRLQANGADCRMEAGSAGRRIYAPGTNYPGLSVTRAFGDFSVMNHGVISEPNVFPRKGRSRK